MCYWIVSNTFLVGNGDIKDDLIWAPHAQGKTQVSQLEQIRTAAADHGCVSVSSATTVLGTLAVKWVRHTQVVLWLGVLGAPQLLADCPAMSFVFVCWHNITNEYQKYKSVELGVLGAPQLHLPLETTVLQFFVIFSNATQFGWFLMRSLSIIV